MIYGEGAKLPQKVATECKNSKTPSRNIRSSAAQNIQNALIEHILIEDAPKDHFYVIFASKIKR